ELHGYRTPSALECLLLVIDGNGRTEGLLHKPVVRKEGGVLGGEHGVAQMGGYFIQADVVGVSRADDDVADGRIILIGRIGKYAVYLWEVRLSPGVDFEALFPHLGAELRAIRIGRIEKCFQFILDTTRHPNTLQRFE